MVRWLSWGLTRSWWSREGSMLGCGASRHWGRRRHLCGGELRRWWRTVSGVGEAGEEEVGEEAGEEVWVEWVCDTKK